MYFSEFFPMISNLLNLSFVNNCKCLIVVIYHVFKENNIHIEAIQMASSCLSDFRMHVKMAVENIFFQNSVLDRICRSKSVII